MYDLKEFQYYEIFLNKRINSGGVILNIEQVRKFGKNRTHAETQKLKVVKNPKIVSFNTAVLIQLVSLEFTATVHYNMINLRSDIKKL